MGALLVSRASAVGHALLSMLEYAGLELAREVSNLSFAAGVLLMTGDPGLTDDV
jgi:hypothetical protein